ncbi:tigger transposable element-derived 1-like [Pelobates cultripes]|nr:tigger transposable element-derived 1-like [Pelobates cultripes]
MVKRLSIRIDDELERNMSLSQAILMEKSKRIYAHIQSQDPNVMESFAASRGWFDRFTKRYNLYNLKITGEAAIADTGAAAAFPASFKDVVDRGSYPPEVVFNVVVTGLFWKRMPSRTFISREQKRAPGFKASKDRLTLLVGGNASVISTFKACYLHCTFHQLIEHTDCEDKQSMLDFWKQYHIMKAISNIDLSWKEVTQQCLKAVWKKIWLELCEDVQLKAVWKKIWLELCEDVQLPEPIIAEIVDPVTPAGLGDTDA